MAGTKIVGAKTMVELHEFCLDICPYTDADRSGICPKCPVYKHVQEKGWRAPFGDAVKVIKAWSTYVGKTLK